MHCWTYVQGWIIDVIWNCSVFLNVIINLSKEQHHRLMSSEKEENVGWFFFFLVSAEFLCAKEQDKGSRSVLWLALFLCVLMNLRKKNKKKEGGEVEKGGGEGWGKEWEPLCALEAARSQCVSKGFQSRDDQRFGAQHIHQGSPQGQESRCSAETNKNATDREEMK